MKWNNQTQPSNNYRAMGADAPGQCADLLAELFSILDRLQTDFHSRITADANVGLT